MEYKFLYHYRYFKAWVDHRLSAIADPDVEAIVPFAIDHLILMLHLSIFINHTVEIGPLHSTPTTSKA